MNCGFTHFGNEVMQLSNRHASICVNYSLQYRIDKVTRFSLIINEAVYAITALHNKYSHGLMGIS